MRKLKLLAGLICARLLFSFAFADEIQRLRADGTGIVDESESPVVLRGLTLSGLPEVRYWGLAVCSHDNTILTEARFRRVLQRQAP